MKNQESGPLSNPKTVDKVPNVDLAKAETVVELLEFPECILDMVVLALLDVGCDTRAAVLIGKYPQDSMRRIWDLMAVRALLDPGEEALTQLCRRVNDRREIVSIVSLGAKALTGAGCSGVAAVLESEFRFSRSSQRRDVDEAAETEGRRLAAKLRRCAPHLEDLAGGSVRVPACLVWKVTCPVVAPAKGCPTPWRRGE
jgi:hypothetical protein